MEAGGGGAVDANSAEATSIDALLSRLVNLREFGVEQVVERFATNLASKDAGSGAGMEAAVGRWRKRAGARAKVAEQDEPASSPTAAVVAWLLAPPMAPSATALPPTPLRQLQPLQPLQPEPLSALPSDTVSASPSARPLPSSALQPLPERSLPEQCDNPSPTPLPPPPMAERVDEVDTDATPFLQSVHSAPLLQVVTAAPSGCAKRATIIEDHVLPPQDHQHSRIETAGPLPPIPPVASSPVTHPLPSASALVSHPSQPSPPPVSQPALPSSLPVSHPPLSASEMVSAPHKSLGVRSARSSTKLKSACPTVELKTPPLVGTATSHTPPRSETSAAINTTSARLISRCERAATRAGLDNNGELLKDLHFPLASEVAVAAAKLRAVAFEAHRTEEAAVERLAVRLTHRALTHARTLQRSEDLASSWQERHAATAPDAATALNLPRAQGILSPIVAAQVERAFKMSKRFKATTDGEPRQAAAGGGNTSTEATGGDASADTMLADAPASPPERHVFGTGCHAIASEEEKSDGKRELDLRRSRACGWRSAYNAGKTTYTNVLGHVSLEPNAYREALLELPAAIPVPEHTTGAMCSSLAPVLSALDRGLDYKSIEYQAAKNAYASWCHESWWDPRGDIADGRGAGAGAASAAVGAAANGGSGGGASGCARPKPPKGWTVEQYGMRGFAGLYARSLHVARVATIRQVVLWLLESAPGLPPDGPFSIGDLGAGTCAACLGARFAIRDHAGGEHPFTCWPIDVASSSERFRDAWRAMIEVGQSGAMRQHALLPWQRPSQYLAETQDGVDHLVRSMLTQIRAQGGRQPHLIIASFSLHYLKGIRRATFYALLAEAVVRPLLLLIIKGVDSSGGRKHTPVTPAHVPCTFLGIHYFLGKDPKPRVVEAHLALIRPAAGEPAGLADADHVYDRDRPDAWVLSTYAAVARRYREHGLHTGMTEMAEAEKRAYLPHGVAVAVTTGKQ